MALLDTNKTPIKVPGRRSHRIQKAGPEERKKLNRSRGRPLKMASAKTSDTASDRSTKVRKGLKVRSLNNIKSKRDMSLLERLPTEILEEVFFYSMNVDLPRSSPVIGGKLSSEAVYNQTIISAFEETWEVYYTSAAAAPSRPTEGNDKLQSAILRCRWASLTRLLRSQDICMRRQNAHRVRLEPILWLTRNEMYNLDSHIQDVVLTQKTVAERFNEDFEAYLQAVKDPSWNDQVKFGQDCVRDCRHGWKDIAEGVEIPHSLLLGPWTEDKTRYLYWLVKSGATLNWLTSTSGEVAVLGFKDAIQSGNFPIIILLVRAGMRYNKLDVALLTWALQNLRGNRDLIMAYLLAVAELSDSDKDKFDHEVVGEQVRAKLESDQERITFLDTVRAEIEYL